MLDNVFHAILIDKAFRDPELPENFKIFATRYSKDLDWHLYGVEIEKNNLDKAIKLIQDGMKSDAPYYTHFYDGEQIIVVFKEKIFNVKSDKSTWEPILKFGRETNIPEEQLDFWPYRFEQESEYFSSF